MSTRLNIPALGVDQIVSPRVSDEGIEPAQPDDPTNLPEVDLADPDDPAEDDRPDDDETDTDESDTEREIKDLPLPGEPLTAGHYADFDVAEAEVPLAEDPETSMVESVFLHLLSEHFLYEALHLEERDAFDLHAKLHRDAPRLGLDLGHEATDLRFRPLKALANSMQYVENAESIENVSA